MDNAIERFKGNVSASSQRLNTLGAKASSAGAAISLVFNNVNTVLGKGISRLGECHQKLKLIAVTGVENIVNSVQDAADANQIVNKFGVVFKELAPQTREWAEEYANTIGRSQFDTMKWLSGFQNFFYPLGYAREDAALLSQKMVKLATDLGSFNEVTTNTATDALQSYLAGNYEAAHMFDIYINDADVKTYAYQKGIAKLGSELTEYQKIEARRGLISAKSADALDHALSNVCDYNNQLLRLQGNLRDVSVGIGNEFLPAFRRGLIEVNEFLQTLKGSERLKTTAHFLSIATAVLSIATAIGFASAAYKALGGFFNIKNFLMAGALVGLVLLIEDLWVALSGGEAVLKPVIGWLKEHGTTIKWLAGIIATFFAPAILSVAIPAMVKWVSFMAFATKYHIWNLATTTWKVVAAIGGLWKAIISKGVKGLVTFGGKVGSVILRVARLGGSLISDATKSVFIFASSLIKRGIASLISFGSSLMTTAATAIPSLIGGLAGAASGVWAFTAALLANPITWIVVGIVALGAAIYGVVQNWDKITGFVKNIWGSFTSWIGTSLLKTKERFQNWGTSIRNWFAERGITLPEFKMPNLPDLAEKIKGWGASIREKAKSIWGGMKSWFEDKTGIKLPEFQFPKLPDIKDMVCTWIDNIRNFFDNLDLGLMLKGVFDKALDLIPQPLKNLANKILGFLPQSPAKEGPLSSLDKVGPGLVNTIGEGIEGAKDNLTLSVSHMWEGVNLEPQMQFLQYPMHNNLQYQHLQSFHKQDAKNLMQLQGIDETFKLAKVKELRQSTKLSQFLQPLNVTLPVQPQGLITNEFYNQQNNNRKSSSVYNPRSQQSSVVSRVDKIEIVINGNKNPESTAKAVRKELELYFSEAHASVVGD